ncbi:pRL2-11 [Kitasatospora sp. NPDC088783]|uniref:pRL2-11 n=1 Tax=Kitasatospora sp. NPDC088783 TaxID=3364077 RepID=UPI003829203C
MGRSGADQNIEAAIEAVAVGAGRFLTGRELDGVRRTNATFLRKGTRVNTDVEGRVGRWSHLPYWKRIVVRLGMIAALAAGTRSYLLHPQATLQALKFGVPGIAVVALAGAVVHAVRNRGQAELLREWVRPLHLALVGPLGLSVHTDPRSYLHVPLNFADDDAEIRIDLPVDLKFSESGVTEMVVKKLALQGVSFSWKPESAEPYVIVKKVHRPPSKVAFSDPKVRELVRSVPESAPLIGLERGERIVSVDLDSESPHVLVNAGTGGGKSVILRTIAAQLIHHGAQAYILDFKRVSHQWARGVPSVVYCRDIAEIHDALVKLGVEGRRRIHAAEHLGDDADPKTIGPRIVILLEEINATMKQLSKYWDSIKEKGDPKTSPAVDALAEVLFMGRAVRLHVLLVAQSATARALGGPEMRENFATRILARYTQNAWRMLVPEVSPAPKSTRHIGRAQVVLGGQAHETQVLFMSDAEAREWARSGTESSAGPGAEPAAGEPAVTLDKAVPVPEADTVEDSWPDPSDVAADRGTRHDPKAPAPDDGALDEEGPMPTAPVPAAALPAAPGAPVAAEALVSLREAAETVLPELTVSALRNARNKDLDFPEPAEKRGRELVYRSADLARWARNRALTPAGSTVVDEDD